MGIIRGATNTQSQANNLMRNSMESKDFGWIDPNEQLPPPDDFYNNSEWNTMGDKFSITVEIKVGSHYETATYDFNKKIWFQYMKPSPEVRFWRPLKN